MDYKDIKFIDAKLYIKITSSNTILTLTNGGIITAKGGLAGGPAVADVPVVLANSNTPNVSTGGFVNSGGEMGGIGLALRTSAYGSGGNGGCIPRVGSGGKGGAGGVGAPAAGVAGTGYASGGGGSINPPLSSLIHGGNGTQGFAIIYPLS